MLMCRDLARIASDYIDGELGTGKVMSVKMHLLMCGRCRSFCLLYTSPSPRDA